MCDHASAVILSKQFHNKNLEGKPKRKAQAIQKIKNRSRGYDLANVHVHVLVHVHVVQQN